MPSLYLPPKCFECGNHIKGKIHSCYYIRIGNNRKTNVFVNLCENCLSTHNETETVKENEKTA